MTLTTSDFDAFGQALAFVRAFKAHDAEGTNAMLMNLPVDQLPSFTAALASITCQALAVGQVSPPVFFDAMNKLVEQRAAES